MKTTMRKLAAVAAIALTVGGTVAATSTPAAAYWHHGYGWGGGGVAAGVIGGLALGSIVGAATSPYGYGYGYPAYGYAPAYAYGGCRIVPRPVYDGWGHYAGSRPTRVCY